MNYELSARAGLVPTLTAAKLPHRTFYQTRHTFVSNALVAGEAPSWVSQQLGHSSPEMLFHVYSRWIPNRTPTMAVRCSNV